MIMSLLGLRISAFFIHKARLVLAFRGADAAAVTSSTDPKTVSLSAPVDSEKSRKYALR